MLHATQVIAMPNAKRARCTQRSALFASVNAETAGTTANTRTVKHAEG